MIQFFFFFILVVYRIYYLLNFVVLYEDRWVNFPYQLWDQGSLLAM